MQTSISCFDAGFSEQRRNTSAKLLQKQKGQRECVGSLQPQTDVKYCLSYVDSVGIQRFTLCDFCAHLIHTAFFSTRNFTLETIGQSTSTLRVCIALKPSLKEKQENFVIFRSQNSIFLFGKTADESSLSLQICKLFQVLIYLDIEHCQGRREKWKKADLFVLYGVHWLTYLQFNTQAYVTADKIIA